MSILNVDKIQPIGSGSTVTVNATNTILTNAQAGVITATRFDGIISATTDDWITHQGDSNTRMGFPATDIFAVETAGSERLRITSGGTLAINKSSGNYGSPLHIIADASENAITVEGLKAAINWRYTDGSANRRGGIKWNGSTGQVLFDSGVSGNGYYYQFDLNGSERLRITSTGELTMTSDVTKEFIALNTTNNNTRGTISMQGKTSGGAVVTLKMGAFGDTSRGEIFTHSNHDLGFATNNAAPQWKMKTGGDLEIGDGNLVVASGHGIDFSATANPTNGASTSELLDYYEEGTFTPAFGGLSSVSYSTQFGKYTRIGRQVFCTAVIDATGIDESSNITLTGLPYSSTDSSDNQQRSTWLVAYGGHCTGISDATARFRSAGSSWQGVKGTASTSYLTGAQLSSSGTVNITGSFSYYVA